MISTVYGNRVSFITVAAKPSISLSAFPSVITQTSGTYEAWVTYDGGYPVVERGYVWDTLGVTIDTKNKVVVGSDTGRFKIPLTGLLPGTQYNMGVFATTKIGTGFSTKTFTTANPDPPVLTTLPVTSVGSAFYSGGTITAYSGITILERGLLVSNSRYPTETRAVNGSGAGSFTQAVPTFSLGYVLTYSVRTYALWQFKTQTYSTVYGPSVTFTAL